MGLEPHDAGSEEKVPRPPQFADLTRLCSELNRLGARYAAQALATVNRLESLPKKMAFPADELARRIFSTRPLSAVSTPSLPSVRSDRMCIGAALCRGAIE